ncbi:MAG: cytochrome b/b6 domain-containing protein [Chloroflexi bacterium]|nr:cytochrome b/b6 domain-containing protein [Chloroflexota bacterium]
MNERASTEPKLVQAEEFVRFNPGQRLEHFLLMVAFLGLCLTGIPQKFYGEAWASWLILLMGGIETTRLIHRFFAVLLVLESLYHVFYIVLGLLRGNQRPSMVPKLQDFRDSFGMLRYSVGLLPEPPKFDRYDYRQKFEYWGLVLGNFIMIATGAILWFPVLATRLLPGELIPAAKEAHSGEALLALLVITVWHLYSVHLSPVQFPGDTSIFTGRISKRRLIEEHPLEYLRLARLGRQGIRRDEAPSPSLSANGGQDETGHIHGEDEWAPYSESSQ